MKLDTVIKSLITSCLWDIAQYFWCSLHAFSVFFFHNYTHNQLMSAEHLIEAQDPHTFCLPNNFHLRFKRQLNWIKFIWYTLLITSSSTLGFSLFLLFLTRYGGNAVKYWNSFPSRYCRTKMAKSLKVTRQPLHQMTAWNVCSAVSVAKLGTRETLGDASAYPAG